jgi:SAM-dependent methyltransferase
MDDLSLAARLAAGPPLGDPPAVIDIRATTPPNPPETLQVQFVGLSFEKAYAEGETFVGAVVDALAGLGHPGLKDARVLDFGSGWGRISRVLLTEVTPPRLFAADVDPEMTALVNVTLPGVNAMTVPSMPPTVLADGSMDVIVAFSVFSHLSGTAHQAWAREFARLLRPGGVAAITVLGEDFIDLVAGSQVAVTAGRADEFSSSMAQVFSDPEAARRGFHADRIQFGATGGGGVRTSDYYGWAAVSRRGVERIWGDAGLELVRWHPSGELFPQALAVLHRPGDGPVRHALRAARRTVRHAVARRTRRVRNRLPGRLVQVRRIGRRRPS